MFDKGYDRTSVTLLNITDINDVGARSGLFAYAALNSLC